MIVLIVVAVVAGVVGSVAFIAGSLLRTTQPQQVQISATPSSPTPRTVVVYVTPKPTPVPTPESPPQSAKVSRITFTRGGITATVRGSKGTFDFHDYYIRAQAGQVMDVGLLANRGISFQVLNSTGDQILTIGLQQQWEGTLPYTGDYVIRVLGPAGQYTLSVTVYPL